MDSKKIKSDSLKQMILTITVLILIISLTIGAFWQVHKFTEKECHKDLHIAAESVDWQVGEILNNTYLSLNNLSIVLTNLCKLNTDECINIFHNTSIGNMHLPARLYLPDGTIITGNGVLNEYKDTQNYKYILSNFDSDNRFISCAKKDITNNTDILELYYPVIIENQTVAIISAVMDLSVLKKYIKKIAYNGESNIVVIDRRDGTYILDTDHEGLLNIDYYRNRTDEKGNSISQILTELMDGEPVFYSFKSKRSGRILYNCSLPSKSFKYWTSSISVRKQVAFKADYFIRNLLIFITTSELIIFILYFLYLLYINRKEDKQQIKESLTFTNFFLDTYVSAYYVNLDDLSCQIYKRTDDLEKKYPIISNYFESLVEYINNDVHPDDRESLLDVCRPKKMKEILKKETEYSHIFRDISNNQDKTYKMQVIRGSEECQAAFGFIDISKEVYEQQSRAKEAEEARLAAEASNKAKTNFLFNMSHDIRTPMNAIIGFTNMAIKHIENKNQVLENLEKSKEAGNMLLSLINSVLEVSRIESGQANIEPKPADIYYSFSNLEQTMKEFAATKDINLSFSFGNIKNRFIYADFSRCNGTFINIISNAIKYTPEGGKITVRCEQLNNSKDGYGTYQYTFEDNGIGISDEFQKHIFDQFSREKTSTISGIQGTGLGMFIVKSYVDLMGGTVSVKSKQGKGSLFTITLPFKIQEGELYSDPITGAIIDNSKKKGLTNTLILKGKKVLLAEDNAFNREIAIDILKDQNLIVEEAEDGAKAVQLLKDKGPKYYDFILMDIQMPVMDGYEATKLIRKMYPDKHIPIIALSANAFVEDKEKSLQIGMDAHVAKPINITELFSVLSKLIKQE